MTRTCNFFCLLTAAIVLSSCGGPNEDNSAGESSTSLPSYDEHSIYEFSTRHDLSLEDVSDGMHEAIRSMTLIEFQQEPADTVITAFAVLSSSESVTASPLREDHEASPLTVVNGGMVFSRRSTILLCCHASGEPWGGAWFLIQLELAHPMEGELSDRRMVLDRLEWLPIFGLSHTPLNVMNVRAFETMPTDDDIVRFVEDNVQWVDRRSGEVAFANYVYPESWHELLGRPMSASIFAMSER